jgi:hypothetical protein
MASAERPCTSPKGESLRVTQGEGLTVSGNFPGHNRVNIAKLQLGSDDFDLFSRGERNSILRDISRRTDTHVVRLPIRAQGKMGTGPALVSDLGYLLYRAFYSGFRVWVIQSSGTATRLGQCRTGKTGDQ